MMLHKARLQRQSRSPIISAAFTPSTNDKRLCVK